MTFCVTNVLIWALRAHMYGPTALYAGLNGPLMGASPHAPGILHQVILT